MSASDECGSYLRDDRIELRCDRASRHYNKPHRAIGSWMENSGGMVSAVVTWAVSGVEWSEAPA